MPAARGRRGLVAEHEPAAADLPAGRRQRAADVEVDVAACAALVAQAPAGQPAPVALELDAVLRGQLHLVAPKEAVAERPGEITVVGGDAQLGHSSID